MLPRGMRRESVASLGRADLIVMTRTDQVSDEQLDALRRRLAGLARGAPILAARHQPVEVCDQRGDADPEMPIESARGRRAWVFAGLGNPEGFAATVERMGFQIVGRRYWPDHHAWSDDELDDMARQACQASPDIVLTTEKDAVRLPPDRPHWPVPLRVVRIGIEFLGNDAETIQVEMDKMVQRRQADD